MGAQVKLVLLATTAVQGTSPALEQVGGQSLIAYWLNSLKFCTRLLPPHNKVYIVTSPATHSLFLQWANDRQASHGGFPTSNLLQFTESIGESAPVKELQFALGEMPSLNEGYVMVADLSYFLGMDIPLQRFVEHAVVRGKDTLIYSVLPPNHPLEQHTEVILTGPEVNPKVTGIHIQPVGISDGISTAVMAPLAILHPTSLPVVDRAVSSATGIKQLADLVAKLAASKPVHALEIDMFVDCSTDYGLAYSRAFTNFYVAEMEAVRKRGPAAEALTIVTAAAQESGTITVGYQQVEELMHAVPVPRQLLLKFDVMAEQHMEQEAGVPLSSTGKFGPRDIPARLADATVRRHNPKQQHPVYETTANMIGKKKPTQMDMPNVYAGSTQAFTKTFAGPYKARGLITSVTTSKVHRLLDDF